jgi:tetratricopeptide (TPR) repeat protein
VGELDLAQQYAEQTLHAEPDLRLRAQAHSLLGNLAYEREKPTEAETHYRDAAGLFEAVRDTGAAARQLAAVGQMLLAQGRTAEAVDELHAAVDRMPNDLLMQTELAWALWQLGEGRAAVAILTSVLDIDGANAEALRARGEILADLGDARGAMLDLDRQSAQGRPSTRAARGLALAALGDHLAASQEVDDAVDKAPRNGPVLLYAARAYALGGDKIFSGELARRAVDATDPPLSPPHREAALRLAQHP